MTDFVDPLIINEIVAAKDKLKVQADDAEVAVNKIEAYADGLTASIDEAPTDGVKYTRKDASWVPADPVPVQEAPEDGTIYGRQNGSWVPAGAGGGTEAVWGSITGTLSAQTDLQSALDAKTTDSTLATVAKTGAYADLSGKPTVIPEAPSNGKQYARKNSAWAEVQVPTIPTYEINGNSFSAFPRLNFNTNDFNVTTTVFYPESINVSLKPISATTTWGGITGTLANQTDLQSALNAKANTSSLKAVATSGSYADLSLAPTLDGVSIAGKNIVLGENLTSTTAGNTVTINAAGGGGGGGSLTPEQIARIAWKHTEIDASRRIINPLTGENTGLLFGSLGIMAQTISNYNAFKSAIETAWGVDGFTYFGSIRATQRCTPATVGGTYSWPFDPSTGTAPYIAELLVSRYTTSGNDIIRFTLTFTTSGTFAYKDHVYTGFVQSGAPTTAPNWGTNQAQ